MTFFEEIQLKNKIYDICLIKKKFLFTCCKDKTIKIIDIKSGKIIKNLIGHKSSVININIVIHPKYGELLFSQEFSCYIKLWLLKK